MATYNGMSEAKSAFHLGIFICTGAAAATNITCTGITTNSTIIAAFHVSTAASVATIAQVDLDELSVTAANTVQMASTDTSSDQLLVFWTNEDK